MQMPLNLSNAVATARQLLAYTVEAANFSDKMDVIFVAEMIEKFGRFTKEEKSKEVFFYFRFVVDSMSANGHIMIVSNLCVLSLFMFAVFNFQSRH